jgi:hypothetical protein
MLAQKAGVALSTVMRMESNDDSVICSTVTMEKVSRTLQAAGIQFLNDSEPGVRLSKNKINPSL